jgi:hypothetical protein
MRFILRLLVILFCGAVVFASGCAKLQGVKTLMSVGASDKLKERASAQETENFQRVKAHIQNETLEAGMSEKDAVRKFGDPVVVIDQDSRIKWAYKPAESEWFSGEKAYLFFDREGRLVSWQYLQGQ